MQPNFQIYSIGSAIVDFEFQITREQDWPRQIEKGTTILIDDATEKLILQKFHHIQPVRTCGGSGANTLSVISKLGGSVFYSCNVADDADGDLYHRNLKSSGIVSNLDTRVKTPGTTGKCMILISPDADRTLCTSQGASGLLAMSDINETILANAEYFFVEIFLATSPTAKTTAINAMHLARKLNTKVALTLTTCKIPGFNKQHLFDMTEQTVDLLFCNELEASYFCDTHDFNSMIAMLSAKAHQFVMTRGDKSTILFDGKKLYETATYPVKAVNSNGAGDVFAGAFLYALTAGISFPAAGDFANFAAARIITKHGARLDEQDVEVIKQKFSQFILATSV